MAFSAVDPPRSASRTPTSPSRRSFPNLHHLSLAPLSDNFSNQALTPHDTTTMDPVTTSYIQPKTAPSTPGILSRSPSRHRSHLNVRYVDATSYFPDNARPTNTAMTKAKSDVTLDTNLPQSGRHHSRSKSSTFALSTRKPPTPKHHQHREASDDGWLYRAGLAIASETRESKGQSWLSRRESSTSLVRQAEASDSDDDNAAMGPCSGLHSRTQSAMFADDEFSPVTPRFGSRQHSRRGSRVAGMSMTPRGSRTPIGALSRRSSADYLDDADDAVPMEPDFVDDEGSSIAEDDEEVARLARERGFGLGGWMDKLMGWTLFSVDEDGEETTDDDDDDDNESDDLTGGDDTQRRREMEVKRRRDEWARIEAASRAAKEKKLEELPEPRDSEGGWQDAAWLLSVASKVLL
ncbi:hypothetical protein IWX90DRAFT_447231 [Phyllosticta citrichinensis]|uniref:Uncharacterized protein n=1 Tax=Phyllosticta citrichinensis TaxID=1130410 RepID=A0ABR1Y5M1_9PEZI